MTNAEAWSAPMKTGVSSIFVTILNATAQIASFVVFAAIAGLFGATRQTDAFFLALTIPALYISAVVNAITSVFIPVMTEWRAHRRDAMGDLVGAVLIYGFFVSLIACGVVVAVAPLLLTVTRRGGANDLEPLALQNIYTLLPLLPLQTLIGILAAQLNSAGRFVVPATAVTVRFAATLVAVVALRPMIGAHALPWSFVIGGAAQCGLIALFSKGVRFHASAMRELRSELFPSFRLAVPLIVGTASLQLSVIVSRMLAASLGPGRVSILDYANRISFGVMESLTGGVMLVVLAEWSRLATTGEIDRLREKVQQAVLMVMFFVLPLTMILAALRREIIHATLQRGRFSAELGAETAAVLIFFLVGIPFDAIGRLYVRILLVWKRTWVLGLQAVLRLAITTLGSLILMRVIQVRGIALADTISVVLSGIGLAAVTYRRLGRTKATLWFPLGRLLFCACVAGAVAAAFGSLLRSLSVWMVLPLAASIGAAAYLLVAYIMKATELTTALAIASEVLRLRRVTPETSGPATVATPNPEQE